MNYVTSVQNKPCDISGMFVWVFVSAGCLSKGHSEPEIYAKKCKNPTRLPYVIIVEYTGR